MLCTSAALRKVLEKDITDTLARLRAVRDEGDKEQITVAEKRLDWMLDRLVLLLEEIEEQKEGRS